MSDKYLSTYKSVMSILKQDVIQTIIDGTNTGTFNINIEERDKLIRVLEASFDAKSYEMYNVMQSAVPKETSVPKKSGGRSGKSKK